MRKNWTLTKFPLQEIVVALEAALEQFRLIAGDLGGEGVDARIS